MFELTVQNADGKVETFTITGEHPVHVEDWVPSTVEELLVSLTIDELPSVAEQGFEIVQNRQLVSGRGAGGDTERQQTSSLPAGLEPYDYFPSEETTKFGAVAPEGALGVRAFQTITIV